MLLHLSYEFYPKLLSFFESKIYFLFVTATVATVANLVVPDTKCSRTAVNGLLRPPNESSVTDLSANLTSRDPLDIQ